MNPVLPITAAHRLCALATEMVAAPVSRRGTAGRDPAAIAFLPFRPFGARVDTARVAGSRLIPGGKRFAMRKYLVLSVLGVCLLMLMPGTTAFAGNSTYYAGKTSQGQKLLFSVDQTANGPKFDPFFTTMIAHCPATGGTFT